MMLFLMRFFIAIWNMLMRVLIALRLMSTFRKLPWLHAVLIFLIMAIAPYAGVFFLIAACVAGSHGAKADNNFTASVRDKHERFMGARSDEEEREAVQGEAMLRAWESGATPEQAGKVYEAMGALYDKQKKDAK